MESELKKELGHNITIDEDNTQLSIILHSCICLSLDKLIRTTTILSKSHNIKKITINVMNNRLFINIKKRI